MAWRIKYSDKAKKQLKQLDKQALRQIRDYLETRLVPAPDFSLPGKRLKAAFSGYWRLRVGDYRLICEVQGKQVTILVLDIGHRRDIYRR